MRLLRIALIPCVAFVLSCSSQTEERSLTQPNPIQPVMGNPIQFPSADRIGGAFQAPTPVPSPTPVASATPNGTTTPAPTATPSTPPPTATPTPGTQATATPTPTTQPSPTPAPTAVPTQSSQPNTIHHIRVGFYGIDCPNGISAPNNGAKLLPVRCRGFVTATPKRANGDDVPASEHGPDIDWELEYGGAFVQVKDSKTSDFNKDLTGVRPGTFNLCATVRGMRGCLDGTVTP